MGANPRFTWDGNYRKRKDSNLFQHNGKWFFDVTVNGIRYKRQAGNSKTEARARLEDFKADIRRGREGRPVRARAIPLAEFVKEYEERHLSRNKSASRDLNALKKHVTPCFGQMLLSAITTDHVERYLNTRETEKTFRGHITSGATINRELALLRSIMNRALAWGRLAYCNVQWKAIPKRPERQRDRVLSADEAGRFMAEAAKIGDPFRAVVVLALNTGLRLTEILSLNWSAVDLDQRQIKITRLKKKQQKEEWVPVNEDAVSALAELQRKRTLKSDFVFYNPSTNTRYLHIRGSFKSACKAAKITGFRFHDLRHTFATMLSGKGVPTIEICGLLGHGSEAMTQRYIAAIPENRRKAVDLLAGQFKASEKTRKEDGTGADAEGPKILNMPKIAQG